MMVHESSEVVSDQKIFNFNDVFVIDGSILTINNNIIDVSVLEIDNIKMLKKKILIIDERIQGFKKLDDFINLISANKLSHLMLNISGAVNKYINYFSQYECNFSKDFIITFVINTTEAVVIDAQMIKYNLRLDFKEHKFNGINIKIKNLKKLNKLFQLSLILHDGSILLFKNNLIKYTIESVPNEMKVPDGDINLTDPGELNAFIRKIQGKSDEKKEKIDVMDMKPEYNGFSIDVSEKITIDLDAKKEINGTRPNPYVSFSNTFVGNMNYKICIYDQEKHKGEIKENHPLSLCLLRNGNTLNMSVLIDNKNELIILYEDNNISMINSYSLDQVFKFFQEDITIYLNYLYNYKNIIRIPLLRGYNGNFCEARSSLMNISNCDEIFIQAKTDTNNNNIRDKHLEISGKCKGKSINIYVHSLNICQEEFKINTDKKAYIYSNEKNTIKYNNEEFKLNSGLKFQLFPEFRYDIKGLSSENINLDIDELIDSIRNGSLDVNYYNNQNLIKILDGKELDWITINYAEINMYLQLIKELFFRFICIDCKISNDHIAKIKGLECPNSSIIITGEFTDEELLCDQIPYVNYFCLKDQNITLKFGKKSPKCKKLSYGLVVFDFDKQSIYNQQVLDDDHDKSDIHEIDMSLLTNMSIDLYKDISIDKILDKLDKNPSKFVDFTLSSRLYDENEILSVQEIEHSEPIIEQIKDSELIVEEDESGRLGVREITDSEQMIEENSNEGQSNMFGKFIFILSFLLLLIYLIFLYKNPKSYILENQ